MNPAPRFVDLPSDGYDPPTYDTDHPAEQSDPDDYDIGFRDGIKAAARHLDRVADQLTDRGDDYKAAIVQSCVNVVRMTGR